MKKKVFGIVIVIMVILGLFFSNDSSDNHVIKFISYNGTNLRISIDGQSSSTLPTSGTYYLANYDCNNVNTKIIWDKTNYTLDVSNGTKKGSIACYLEFKSKPLLSEMEVGSYVKYTGDSNNGCDDSNLVNGYTSCSGKNANYVDDLNMGRCRQGRFYINGWRIGYIENGSAYLISAGAPECVCTDSDGVMSSSSCSTSLTTENIYKHIDNLNSIALKYCNKNYAKGGLCNNVGDNATVWAMNIEDVKKITNCNWGVDSCYYNNDFIDNGSFYWLASVANSGKNIHFWRAFDGTRIFDNNNSSYIHGVRPVLYLDSTVSVVGGSGTYEDPYIISNNAFVIHSGVTYINSSDDTSGIQLALESSGDVSTMCVSVDTSVCTNYVTYSDTYTLDWSTEEDGEKIVYVYYKDSSGEIIASMNRSIIIDTVAPIDNSITISDGTGVDRTLTLSSIGASYMCFSNTSSSVSDCTDWVDYVTTYSWTLTSDVGEKTVYAFFKDEAGNISNSISATTTVS